MIIVRIEIENFRSLKNIDVECDNLTVLLGRNGTGKSSLLHALNAFYNVAFQANDYDYFDKDTNADITIRVTYGQLRDDELEEFASQISDDVLIVTKVINAGGAKYYGASRQIPEFSEFRTLAAAAKRAGFNALVDSNKYEDLGERVRSAGDADASMLLYEEAHPELLETFQAEQQFLGARNIGGGKLDNYTKFLLIPAVRDASSEQEKKGAILQLIEVLVMRSVNKRPDVRALNQDFEQRVREVYSHDNLEELRGLALMVSELLEKYSPGAQLDLVFDEIVPPKIPLPPAVASLVEDNFKCPISYAGHGLQRALIFALLQQLAITDLSPEVIIDDEEVDSEVAGEAVIEDGVMVTIGPDLILAIEEPELYLHPSRSRYLSQVMEQLSQTPEQQGDPKSQLLLATHSPYFINMERFDRIRISRKVATEDYDTLQSQMSLYTWTAAAERLAEITGLDRGNFTAESLAARLSPVMTALVNEGFFADVVVVVEGVSDAAILWAMQEVLNKNWDAKGIVIVPVGGKNNIDRPVVIFEGFNIPTYFVFDGDSKHKGVGNKEENNTINSNRVLMNLAGVAVEDFPETQAQEGWAVFENDIEEVVKSVGEELFNKIRDGISDELGVTKPSTLLKNPNAAALFIKKLYEVGCKLPILEEIVEKVSNLQEQ